MLVKDQGPPYNNLAAQKKDQLAQSARLPLTSQHFMMMIVLTVPSRVMQGRCKHDVEQLH